MRYIQLITVTALVCGKQHVLVATGDTLYAFALY